MQRLWLDVGVSLAAFGLGVWEFFHGQALFGICFIGLAILRVVAKLSRRKPQKPEPSVRLNLDDSDDDEE